MAARRKLERRTGPATGLRGPNALTGLRGPNALTGLRGPNALTVAVALVVAVTAAACGSSSGTAHSAAPPTRPDSGPITAPPTTHPPAEQLKTKSQPYWVPVADLKGTGPTTTAPFTIDPKALQWRVTFTCQGAFNAVAIDAAGQPAKRPIADVASCDDEGKGYGTGSGAFTLQVKASAPWTAKIEQQIDTPLVEPVSPALAGAKVVATAKMYGVDRQGEGTAKVYRLADGSQFVRLEDFYVTINSDLELRFSPLAQPKTTDEIAAAPFAEVGGLKATVGSMNFQVPPGVDLSGYHSIVIWCEITRNAYAAASLQAA